MSLFIRTTGAGRDLVLLHGWGVHGGAWSSAAPELAQRFRVHQVDLPGHGFSAFVPFRGFEQAVEDVAEIVPDGAIVCGWSLGGLIAQRLARRHPYRVGALALVGTTPCFVERADWPHAIKAETLAGFASGLRTDFELTLKTFVALNAIGGANTRPALRALAKELLSRGAPDPSALDAGLQALREVDLRAEAPSIAQPAVVIHGARDALAPVEAGRWLARTLPNATAVELDDAAHLPFITHRAAFVAALARLDG